MKPVNNWSVFGDQVNEHRWIRWPPVLAAQTLSKMGFGWGEQTLVACLLVRISPYSDEVECNLTSLAREVGLSDRTAVRCMEKMFSAGLVKLETGTWSNKFMAKYNVSGLLSSIRKNVETGGSRDVESGD